MAKIIQPPKDLKLPTYTPDMDWKTVEKREAAWLKKAAEWAKKKYPTDPNKQLIGRMLYFPVGDGQAMYMVVRTRPWTLMYCPLGDAWQVDEARLRSLTGKYVALRAV